MTERLLGEIDVRYFETLPRLDREVNNPARILVMISGSGTNLQRLIDDTQCGEIPGYIAGVISNKPKKEAYGVERAESYDIPCTVFKSQGLTKDPILREAYEAEITKHVVQINPDLVVLAGWMFEFRYDFLPQMQAQQTAVLNLHPALFKKNEPSVWTSRGWIRAIRGTHAIEQAYVDDTMPLSGVTAHLLRPAQVVDSGPTVLQQEVLKSPGESLSDFEVRMHKAEYQVLPEAVRRVLFVVRDLKIDVAQADFPWYRMGGL